jgi:hypothetical protein
LDILIEEDFGGRGPLLKQLTAGRRELDVFENAVGTDGNAEHRQLNRCRRRKSRKILSDRHLRIGNQNQAGNGRGEADENRAPAHLATIVHRICSQR